MKEILEELPFGPTPEHRVVVNSKFRISLDRALSLYRTSREEALKSVYKQKEIMRTRSLEVEADIEEVAASCGHFSFSLLDFGEQLKDLMAILDELQLEFEERPNGRSWNWLKFWRWRTGNSNDADAGKRSQMHIPVVDDFQLMPSSRTPDLCVRSKGHIQYDLYSPWKAEGSPVQFKGRSPERKTRLSYLEIA